MDGREDSIDPLWVAVFCMVRSSASLPSAPPHSRPAPFAGPRALSRRFLVSPGRGQEPQHLWWPHGARTARPPERLARCGVAGASARRVGWDASHPNDPVSGRDELFTCGPGLTCPLQNHHSLWTSKPGQFLGFAFAETDRSAVHPNRIVERPARSLPRLGNERHSCCSAYGFTSPWNEARDVRWCPPFSTSSS